MIETRALTKRFGSRTAVAGVDLTVPAGCAFGFLGHNGAGKTTVIRLLTGLTQPDSGMIPIGGRPLAGRRAQALARVGAKRAMLRHASGTLTDGRNSRRRKMLTKQSTIEEKEELRSYTLHLSIR